MKLSAILAPMIAAGVPGDIILATVRAFEDERADLLERRRESDRIRQAKSRESRDTFTESRDRIPSAPRAPDHAHVEDNLQTKNLDGREGKKEKTRGDLFAFKSELSPILDTERIEALCDVRRKKGATFSAHAGRLLAKALRACPDIGAAADEMVLRNWTGIKPDWLESRRAQNAHGPPNGKRMNAVEAHLSRRSSEYEHRSGASDNRDAELLPPDKPGLPSPVVDLGQAFSRPFRSGDH